MIGYQRIQDANPNAGHVLLAGAQHVYPLSTIVTQNVDDLHERAGSRNVIHLHGNIDRVVCQSCHHSIDRAALQKQLESLNPAFTTHIKQLLQQATQTYQQQHYSSSPSLPIPPIALIPDNHDEDAPFSSSASLRPDGDVEIQNESYYSQMQIPACSNCGGILKPAVVFFGANVAPEVHSAADAALDKSDAVLVLGTSLTVWSAFRLIKAALNRGLFIGIINDGPTRADELLTHRDIRIGARISSTLKHLFERA